MKTTMKKTDIKILYLIFVIGIKVKLCYQKSHLYSHCRYQYTFCLVRNLYLLPQT